MTLHFKLSLAFVVLSSSCTQRARERKIGLQTPEVIYIFNLVWWLPQVAYLCDIHTRNGSLICCILLHISNFHNILSNQTEVRTNHTLSFHIFFQQLYTRQTSVISKKKGYRFTKAHTHILQTKYNDSPVTFFILFYIKKVKTHTCLCPLLSMLYRAFVCCLFF